MPIPSHLHTGPLGTWEALGLLALLLGLCGLVGYLCGRYL